MKKHVKEVNWSVCGCQPLFSLQCDLPMDVGEDEGMQDFFGVIFKTFKPEVKPKELQ